MIGSAPALIRTANINGSRSYILPSAASKTSPATIAWPQKLEELNKLRQDLNSAIDCQFWDTAYDIAMKVSAKAIELAESFP